MRFRKKPVVVEAFKWTGRNVDELTVWAAHADLAAKKRRSAPARPGQEQSLPIDLIYLGYATFDLEIRTLEGAMKADHGDWIICGVKGEFYPCKPDIFEATYEAVE